MCECSGNIVSGCGDGGLTFNGKLVVGDNDVMLGNVAITFGNTGVTTRRGTGFL